MIDTVISDLGQVLINFDNNVFFRRMMRYTTRSYEEIRAAIHDNAEIAELFDGGKISPEEFYKRAVAALDARVSYDDFFAAYNDIFSVNESVLAVQKKLKPKYKLVVLSNTDPIRYAYIERRFPEILIFDAYVLSFRWGVMKPAPKAYLEALRLVGARPENALFIDDMRANIEGAERLGIKSLLFSPQTDLEVELERFGVKA